ncbi:hypothetical protein Trydic_g16851 [Trypoxylus dichotomus]
MGNKLCKKKVDCVDGGGSGNHPKSQQQPTPFDRIINRLHLKPKWKSDSHLEQKQAKRCEVAPLNGTVPQRPPRPLSNSKSSDWTDVALEVPDEEEIQLKDPKLSFIFNEDGTPTPPPRKNKKGIREKIEAVAKSGLQALQPKKPVEEPLCVKKTIIYDCPGCDNPNHRHNSPKRTSTPKSIQKQNNKESKRRKNLSIVSLPNYNELKFSVASNGETIDKLSDSEIRKSVHSLPGETKKLSAFSDKRDYITRCRSFGSSLPQLLLHKLSNAKAPLAEIESDDSFGGLDDWDLKFIEHYNPKDSSLPRKTKPQRSEQEVLNDIESLIVNDEEIEPPKPPIRRQESLVKKINRTAAETAHQRSNEIEVPSTGKDTPISLTPPPSPTEDIIQKPFPPVSLADLPTKDEDGKVEHSSLMRILQEFSTKKAQEGNDIEAKVVSDNIEVTSTPPLCSPILNSVNDFLDAERSGVARENQFKDNFANKVLRNVDAITT